jgi:hypothetical protein
VWSAIIAYTVPHRHEIPRPPALKDRFNDPQSPYLTKVWLMLVKYGLERILYRLSRSKHHDAFVLKGALLFDLVKSRVIGSQFRLCSNDF